ncbi:MAG: hypothetical protein ACE5OV_04315 [Candidatus Bathyarchaeia archaeon]
MKQARNWRKLGVREVFEVLYSPVEAFRKIVEKPDPKGVLLILVLFISFTLVEQYVIASKLLLLEQTPDDDEWTESIVPWTSNGVLSPDEADYKVGNYSVKSFVSNGTSIWINITDIGPIDCSEDNGYKELFFWIKWTHENEVLSFKATLRLFAVNESYFERNLTDLILNSSGEWNNVTVNTGPQSQDWDSINFPDWQSVTGLEFRLTWLTSANLTIKIDDLHFRRYVSLVEVGTLGGSITPILVSAALEFTMNWTLWAGLLLLVAKVFREEGGPWTVFFVIIGYVFMVTVVYMIASAALLSTLPALDLPSKAWPPATEEETHAVNALFEERWYPCWAYQLYTILHPMYTIFNIPFYFPFLREVWTMMLCAVATRSLWGITGGKAAGISMVAFIMRSILRFFFGF